jgi:hypothetical protein
VKFITSNSSLDGVVVFGNVGPAKEIEVHYSNIDGSYESAFVVSIPDAPEQALLAITKMRQAAQTLNEASEAVKAEQEAKKKALDIGAAPIVPVSEVVVAVVAESPDAPVVPVPVPVSPASPASPSKVKRTATEAGLDQDITEEPETKRLATEAAVAATQE